MIPLAIPNLCGNEGRYLHECVETNFVSSVGPFVTRFEEMVAEASGAATAVATSAGTTGLHAALVAVGVGRDDLVILQSLTFIASANSIAHCAADPWLIDVDPATWTLDPRLLEKVLAEETERSAGGVRHRRTGRRVGAIMPVLTLGAPADMDAIMAVARRYGIPVVVDAAAALGAESHGRKIGALGADLTVFSFNGNKTVTAGGGGAVAGDRAELCSLVRHLTTTARNGADYVHDRVGFNYRMTNIQAAVGCAQMELLDRFVARKREIAGRYTTELASLPGAGRIPEPEWAKSACWFSGIVVPPARQAELIGKLREAGIDARPFWKPIHLQPPFEAAPAGAAPVSESVWRSLLTLPCSTGLTDEEQTTVIDAVRRAW